MVRTNDWDPAVLKAFRADEFVRTFPGALDAKGTTEDLERVAPLIPDEWLAPSATGTPEQCVAAIRNQFARGCDGVIMHGATPTELAPIVAQYAKESALLGPVVDHDAGCKIWSLTHPPMPDTRHIGNLGIYACGDFYHHI